MDATERRALRRDVFRQSWPLVLQNLARTLMFFVDTAMIGRLDESSLAAMGIAGPLSFWVVSVLASVAVGTLATVARAWGARDVARARAEASASVVLSLALALPLTAVGALALPEFVRLFPVPGAPGAAEAARGFLRFEGAAFGFLCLDLAASGILRGAGATRVPLLATLVANLVNVALNWVFIYGHLGAPAMGVPGAGLATAVAMAVQAVLTFGYLWLPSSPVRLSVAGLRAVGRESLLRLLRVSLPAAVEPLIVQSGFLAFTGIVTRLGATSMAAHRTAIAVESLTFMGGYGFVMAGSALVGQSLGEGRPDRAARALFECARLAVAAMSAMGVLFLVAPGPFVAVFASGPETAAAQALAADCLRIAGFEQPFMALAMALAGGLRGAGDTRSPVAVAIVGVWLVRLPVAWALAVPAGLGLKGVWITMIVDWAVRTLVLAFAVRSGRWKTIRL
jgi:putative MATE family efflux protein